MQDSPASQSDVEEYRDFIIEELHELAWQNNYPINTAAGIFCFLEAFKKRGFEVRREGDDFIFGKVVDLAGQITSLESKLSLKDIPRGWGGKVISSPQAFYDSIYSVFDRFLTKDLREAHHFKRQTKEEEQLSNLRDTEPRKIRNSMEDFLMEYFGKYQEHMLTPVGQDSPVLHPKIHKPQIFDRVVKRFPWELLRSARIIGDEIGCSPTVETLILEYPALDVGDFQEHVLKSAEEIRRQDEDGCSGAYHPSVSVLDELFFGMYLQELAREKGYQLERPQSQRRNLANLAGNNFKALKRGKDLFPTNR